MSDNERQPRPYLTFRAATGIRILLALGGFALLAILLEGARAWSWWAGRVLAYWDIGGEPAALELFVYPAFFTAVLALARPVSFDGNTRFLVGGMLWSAGLFLADPAMRAAIHAVDPALVESATLAAARSTVLYGLLFAWMYLTFRRLVPREAPPEAEADVEPEAQQTAAERPAERKDIG
jgi:hypothetical protein